MDAIMSLFDNADIAKLVPDLEKMLAAIAKGTRIAVLVGPVLLLLLGLAYLFLAPKEANHRFGFKTWFGMGSPQAWRFTQRIAGIVWGALGLILTVVMAILSAKFAAMEPMAMIEKAISCLFWEIGLVCVSDIGICLVVTVCYNSKGQRRRE